MNTETQQLIERLAERMGTTAEHLWGVLVRQAPISSASKLAGFLVLACVLVVLYRVVVKKTKPGGDWNDGCGSIMLPWGAWGLMTVILLAVFMGEVGNIVAGFVNPEYWAMRVILGR
jgi:hypothetical protein